VKVHGERQARAGAAAAAAAGPDGVELLAAPRPVQPRGQQEEHQGQLSFGAGRRHSTEIGAADVPVALLWPQMLVGIRRRGDAVVVLARDLPATAKRERDEVSKKSSFSLFHFPPAHWHAKEGKRVGGRRERENPNEFFALSFNVAVFSR
jgi:hypothetical protein